MKYQLILFSIIIGLFISACSYHFPEPEIEQDAFNDVELLRLYYIGGTFSSGYMDGALYDNGQSSSFFGLIGRKIDDFYNEEIYQSFSINSDRGFNAFESDEQDPIGRYHLEFKNIHDDKPVRSAISAELPDKWIGDSRMVKDFSIPGLTVEGLLNYQKLSENIFFNRIQSNNSKTPLDLLIQNKPKKLIINLGFDELIIHALNGLSGSNRGTMELQSIPSEDEFMKHISMILDLMLAESVTEIFIVNIPNFLNAPYFTGLDPHYVLGNEVSSADIVQFANYYQDFNQMVVAYNLIENGGVELEERRPIIDFDVDGGDKFRSKVIKDESLSDAVLNDGTVIPKIRQLKEGEYLLYSADQKVRQSKDFGSFVPIDDQYVLRADQIEFLHNKIHSYNRVLKELTDANSSIHLVDIYQLFEEIRDEQLTVDGVTFNTRFERYSVYSSDGYYLNPLGNALIANQLILKMNVVLGTDITKFNVNKFPSLQISNGF